jgi:hypothetical protein
MKVCKKCKVEKETSEFHADKSSKDGYYRWCKNCKGEYDKEYRKSEKVQSHQNSKIYRDRKKEYRKKRYNEDLRVVLFEQAKYRAKNKSLPFNIEIEDVLIPEKCPLLEIPLFRKPYGERTGFHMNSPSLDRIQPELGYTKGNVMVISMKANAMKYSANLNELETFCKNSLKLISNVRNNDIENLDHWNTHK